MPETIHLAQERRANLSILILLFADSSVFPRKSREITARWDLFLLRKSRLESVRAGGRNPSLNATWRRRRHSCRLRRRRRRYTATIRHGSRPLSQFRIRVSCTLKIKPRATLSKCVVTLSWLVIDRREISFSAEGLKSIAWSAANSADEINFIPLPWKNPQRRRKQIATSDLPGDKVIPWIKILDALYTALSSMTPRANFD